MKNQPKEIEEQYKALICGMDEIIQKYGILFFTREDLQGMWNFSNQMYERIYGVNRLLEQRFKVNAIMSEIYNSFGDAQLNLGFALKLLKTNKIAKGIRKKRNNNVVMVDAGVFDSLFWMFVGNAWEGIYRMWARLEVLLLYFIYDLDVNDSRDFKLAKNSQLLYYTQIIDDIEKNKKGLIAAPSFKLLRKGKIYYSKVCAERNMISHRRSSLFSRFELRNVSESGMKNILGKDIWSAVSYFPSPKVEVRNIVKAYKNAHATIDAAGAFLSENYSGAIIPA